MTTTSDIPVSNNGPVALPYREMSTKTLTKFNKEIEQAVKVIHKFFNPKLVKDQAIPRELILEAHGLVFITMYKAGFLLSAKIGRGFVISRTASGWSVPSFIATGGVGFGLMGGGEVVHYMIILGSRSAVRTFTRNGQFQLGSEMDIAVGPFGRAATAAINIGRGGIAPNYSYSHCVGLYGGIGLGSAVITTRAAFNHECYGQDKTVRDILSGAVECSHTIPLWEAIDGALGIQRTYSASHRPAVNPRGIACHSCGKYSPNGARECVNCRSLLIFTIGGNSGRRIQGKLIERDIAPSA